MRSNTRATIPVPHATVEKPIVSSEVDAIE